MSILSKHIEQFITTNTIEAGFICLMEQARGKLDASKCQQIPFLQVLTASQQYSITKTCSVVNFLYYSNITPFNQCLGINQQ